MISEIEWERKNNIRELKVLIEKYIPENKKFVMGKIKKEQNEKER